MPQRVEAVQLSAISAWNHATDIVIVGYSLAGTCAALEARQFLRHLLNADARRGIG